MCIRDSPWYKSAVSAGKLTVTKPYGDSGTGKPYVAFTAPIVRAGQTTGAISGAVALDGIKDVIKAIRPTPSSTAFVLASDGQVISHVDDKLALKPSTDVAAGLTPAVLAGMAHEGATPLVLSLGGVPKLLKAHPIAGTDWFLVIALDEAEATAGLSQVFNACLLYTSRCV